MAIFGNKKKKETKEGKEGDARQHHARAFIASQGTAHDIVRAPWFSEKALVATEKGVYSFEVSLRATKAEIAGAIKEIYKVEPRMVRTVNVRGKRKALRTKHGIGARSARRKAYVYLNAGDSIQFA